MSKFKSFITGVVIGASLLGSATYAATSTTLEVYLEKITYMVNGREVKPSDQANKYFNGKEYVPAGLIYKGTTYVPLRFAAESTGNQIQWSGTNKTISIQAPNAPQPSSGPISFQFEDYTKLSQVAKEWVDRSKTMELGQSMTVDGKTYILVTRGTKNTGGYDVKVNSVMDHGSEAVVSVEYVDPAPGDIVTQAITYPYELISIKATDKKIRFEEKSGKYVPTLYGISNLPIWFAESESFKVYAQEMGSQSTKIKGLARVFEATVSYEIVTSTGKVHHRGFVNAAVGAPDWGVFTIDIGHDKIPTGTNKLRIYEESMKDGSKRNVVEFDLKK
jgi:hypothetical protein